MSVPKCCKCHAVCKVIVIYNKLQSPYVALTFPQYAAHTVQLIVFDFGMPQAFYSLQIFWASERGKRTSWFPDMIRNIASSMQFADVSCTAAKLRDGNAQAVAAKCCKYRANLHTDAFPQRDADTRGCFYTRVLLPRDAFHKDMFLAPVVRHDAFYALLFCLAVRVYVYFSPRLSRGLTGGVGGGSGWGGWGGGVKRGPSVYFKIS